VPGEARKTARVELKDADETKPQSFMGVG